MNAFTDPLSLIFLVIAVAVLWRLRSVLGTRTGNERPPVDPYAAREERRVEERVQAEAGDNVITLPTAQGRREDPEEAADARIDKVAPAGSALNGALRTILSVDRDFDPTHFVTGARAAYEMIVTAFAAGDRRELQGLLSQEVFASFSGAIAEREKAGQRMEFTFVGVDRADIVEAALHEGSAQITVRFVSQLISATFARDGSVIDGDPAKVVEVTDIWTFARDVRSRDPNWRLVATEAEA
jgi:Uncharacterized protein conserved in bacteria